MADPTRSRATTDPTEKPAELDGSQSPQDGRNTPDRAADEERDIRGAVACVIYTVHHERGNRDIVSWEELPESAQRHWRVVAFEVLNYLDVTLWGGRP